jgi:hypothetical protein
MSRNPSKFVLERATRQTERNHRRADIPIPFGNDQPSRKALIERGHAEPLALAERSSYGPSTKRVAPDPIAC